LTGEKIKFSRRILAATASRRGKRGTAALVDPQPIAVPANLSQDNTVKAIKHGLEERKWIVVQEVPSLVRATVSASGGVQATVDVSYDAQKIQIKYVASQNLDDQISGGQHMIASRYINWSRNLVLSITQALLQ